MIYNPFRNTINRFLTALLSPFRWVFMWFCRLMPGFKSLGNLPVELIAAIGTFTFLVLAWVFAVVLAEADGNAAFFTRFYYWFVVIPLAFCISLVLYFFLRILFRPPASPYPDIETGWEAGMAELTKAGIDIKNIPLCLVLGMNDSKKIRRFVEASGESFDLHGVTGTGQSLIWYASRNQGYIFLSNIGNVVQFVESTPEIRSSENAEDFTHTADIRDFYNVKRSYDDEPEVESLAAMGTIRADDAPSQRIETDSYEPSEPSPAPTPPTNVRAKMSEEKNRLRYLAGLIKKSRESISPINGMLLNVDVSQVETFPEELSRKLNDDLDTLTEALGVVTTLTAVVSGFERDPGFVDFSERLMEDKGENFVLNKFGKSYRSWAVPSKEDLEKLAHGAVEQFDHFSHLMFARHDALAANRVLANRRMVLFLGRIYSRILPGLKTLLSRGIHAKTEAGALEFPRFAGCYFSGSTDTQDYFVRKIFERVEENQGEIEWTRTTLNREESWSLATNLSLMIGLASFLAFAALWAW